MKKFLIEIGISIIFVSMGTAMCFFELQDYEVVNGYDELYDIETLSATVNEQTPLELQVRDDDISVRYYYVDTNDETVSIDLNNQINYEFSDNVLRIKSHSNYRTSAKLYVDSFLDGLKERKLYYFDSSYSVREDEIVITCTKAQKEFIKITK